MWLEVASWAATAGTAALVVSRLAGFVAISPFPGNWVPAKARVALTLTMGLAISPIVATRVVPVGFGLELLGLACCDFIIGLLIGAAFRFVLAAAEIMAGMVSQASWLSAPMAMNPATGGQSQVLAQVSMLLAILIALGAGAHRVVIAYLLESFHVIPVGSAIALPAAMPSFVDLVGRSLDVGMSLAIPVFAISLAVQAALALVARVAPSLQIFNVGFAVLVAAGLVTFGASIPAVGAGMLKFVGTLPSFLDEVLARLAGR